MGFEYVEPVARVTRVYIYTYVKKFVLPCSFVTNSHCVYILIEFSQFITNEIIINTNVA